jgi:hypothetical protein
VNALVVVDEDYDRAHSSDGVSRLGSYLQQRSHLFVEDWEPLSAASYAATVWSIATAPIMTPPYARVSPALWGIDCRHGDEPGMLLVSLEVRMRWPHDHRDDAVLRGWTDWYQAPCWGSDVHQLTEPGEDRPAALFSARLHLPISEESLPTPIRFGSADVVLAKCAIATIADRINAVAGPVVALIRGLDQAEVRQ